MILSGRRYLAPLSLAVLAGAAACGGQELPPPPTPVASASAEPAAPPPPPAASAVAPEKPQLPDVKFEATTSSDNPAKMPKVGIKTPTAEQLIAPAKAGDFEVKLDVKNWDIQEGGNHVHVILDNHPYTPVWSLKEPLKLSKLLGPSDTLAEGEHLLVAFPSRQNHESVKPGALAMVHFWVGKKGKSEWNAKGPMLIYSRPKGTYNASKADHVLVDWYLSNAELGEGKFTIKATVKGPGVDDGHTLNIKEWKPYALDNLRNGEYTVALELQDKEGKAVPGSWNSTTRTFAVNRDAPEDPAPAPAADPKDKKQGAEKDKAEKHEDKAKAEKKDDKAEKHEDKAKAEKKDDKAEKHEDKAKAEKKDDKPKAEKKDDKAK